jgi:hypothetical protein
LAAQTAQAHVLAVVAPPAPAAKSHDVASGVDAPLSACSLGGLSLYLRRMLLAFTCHTTKMTVSPPRPAIDLVRLLADFAVTLKGPQWQYF